MRLGMLGLVVVTLIQLKTDDDQATIVTMVEMQLDLVGVFRDYVL